MIKKDERLTKTERDILNCMISRYTRAEIMEELKLGSHDLRKMINFIYFKTKVEPRRYKELKEYWNDESNRYFHAKGNCFIFDIDGTLSNVSHRLHLLKDSFKTTEDYDEFNSKCEDDKPYTSTIFILNEFSKAGYTIILLTGRAERFRPLTEAWLKKYNVMWDTIYMRPNDNELHCTDYKRVIYHSRIKPEYNVLGVFEDRDCIVQMWRGLGLTCYQPRPQQHKDTSYYSIREVK